MGVICLKCKYVVEGVDGLHLVSQCPNPECRNKDKRLFRRHPDPIDPKKHEEEKKELEGRRIS